MLLILSLILLLLAFTSGVNCYCPFASTLLSISSQTILFGFRSGDCGSQVIWCSIPYSPYWSNSTAWRCVWVTDIGDLQLLLVFFSRGGPHVSQFCRSAWWSEWESVSKFLTGSVCDHLLLMTVYLTFDRRSRTVCPWFSLKIIHWVVKLY